MLYSETKSTRICYVCVLCELVAILESSRMVEMFELGIWNTFFSSTTHMFSTCIRNKGHIEIIQNSERRIIKFLCIVQNGVYLKPI